MLDLQIKQLIAKYLIGKISSDETKELNAWLEASPDNMKFMNEYISPSEAIAAMEALAGMDCERIRKNIEKKIGEPGILWDKEMGRI